MNPQQPLAGRVALVTGGAVGIGRACALALAGAGAAVGIHFHSSAHEARETLESIENFRGKALLLPADLTVEDQAAGIVDQLVKQTGRLDILVNNAGSPERFSPIEQCSTDLWRRVFDINVTAAFLVTRQAIPHLRACGRGSIINNLSLSVQTGGAGGGGP
jgi:3-oxoacyl-[acyl-carrier protein] reductase